MAKLAQNSRISNNEFKFVIRRAPSDPLPQRDYTDFKSDSQLSFTEKLENVDKYPFYLFMILTILYWINFINGLKEVHVYYKDVSLRMRCVIPDLEKTNWTFEQIKYISHYSNSTNICYYYNHNYKLLSKCSYEQALEVINNFSETTVNVCPKYIFDSNIIFFKLLTEDDAVCDPHLLDLYQHLRFTWIIFVIIIGFLSDIYGRKAIIMACFGISFFSCTLLLFTSSYWINFLLFLVLSASFGGLFLLIFILIIELVNNAIRNYLVGFMHFGINIGIITKIFLYEQIEDWQLYNLATYCTFLVPLHCLWMIPESPRWLLCYKKWPELNEILCNMNYQNRYDHYQENLHIDSNSEPKISFLKILRILLKPIFLKRCVFYGLLLGVVNYIYLRENDRIELLLNSDYALVYANALCSFVSVFVIPMVLNRMGRPMALCICFLILSIIYSGTTTYKSYYDVEIVVAFLCLLMSNNALHITYIISVEMFHTRIRASGVTVSHSIARIILKIFNILDNKQKFDEIFGIYEWTFISGILLICAISCSLIEDTGSVPIADTEYQAIFHF